MLLPRLCGLRVISFLLSDLIREKSLSLKELSLQLYCPSKQNSNLQFQFGDPWANPKPASAPGERFYS
jgi:hypothetical protein